MAFCRITDLPIWKSASIFLGVCGSFSTLGGLTIIADALLAPGNDSVWLSPPAGGLVDFALGWVRVALCWHPATHAARSLRKIRIC